MELNTIHNGDCLEVMKSIPDGSIDMILCDPPYGMAFRSNYRKERYPNIVNDESLNWLPEFVKECFRTTKNNTAHYVFCSFHNIDIFKQEFEKMFKIKNLIVWEKNNTSMGDLYADFAPKFELILFLQKGRRLINGKRDPNILKFNRTGNKLHPTEKPVDLFSYLITKFSSEGETVLDPFCGSGTTAVACLNTKRNYICIEQDPTYFNTAKERILNHESVKE